MGKKWAFWGKTCAKMSKIGVKYGRNWVFLGKKLQDKTIRVFVSVQVQRSADRKEKSEVRKSEIRILYSGFGIQDSE